MNALARIIAWLLLPFARVALWWKRRQAPRLSEGLDAAVEADTEEAALERLEACEAEHAAVVEATEPGAPPTIVGMAFSHATTLRLCDHVELRWSNGRTTAYRKSGLEWLSMSGDGAVLEFSSPLNEQIERVRNFALAKAPHPLLDAASRKAS